MKYERFEVGKSVDIRGIYTFFSATYGKGFYFDGEAHDFYEVVCVIDGQAGITSDSNALVLRCGQAVIHRPNVFHKIWASGEEKTSVIIFSFDGFIDMPEDSFVFDMRDGINEIMRLDAEKKHIFTFSDKSPKSVKPNKRYEQSVFVNKLECFLMKLIQNSSDVEPQSKTAEDYSKIITVLENHIGETLSLDEVAMLCQMSCPKIKKVFSKYAGMGVMTYFNSMKMRRAEEYLRTGMSVKETAYRLGFEDQNYFSFAFKRYMGKSPKMFKEP